MAEHFLTKSPFDRAQCLEYGAGLALESYAALHAALSQRLSPAVADLFAEPLISHGNDAAPGSVSWYTAHEGEGRPLKDLDDTEQARVSAILSRDLRAIRDLLGDAEEGTLVGAALHLAGSHTGDIWVVGGHPVLINWAMLPAGTGRDAASRAAHFAATLGRYLPMTAAPPITEGERSARLEKLAQASAEKPSLPSQSAQAADPGPAQTPSAAAVGGAAGTAPATAATPINAPPAVRRPIGALAWLPLVVLLLLAGAAVIWLLMPGTRIFPVERADIVDDAAAAEATSQINESLETRLAALRAALDGAQCRDDGTLLMPGGRTIEGLLPPVPGNPDDAPGKKAAADPISILPPDPARVQVPDRDPDDPGSTAIDSASLLDMIEARTVMVVARTAEGLSTGTGFFIAPELVVTNLHVVNGAPPGSVHVTSKSLGALQSAQVLKTEGPFTNTGTDFALLRVAGANARHFALLMPTNSLKLQSVIAAGYPGDVLRTDASFAALKSGDARAVPGLTVTDGTVNTEQSLTPGTLAIVHSAPISQGNSGGPLVDMCGRVIGVNTFVVHGNLRNLNFALSTQDLKRFVEGAGVTVDVTSQPCQPQILRPSAPQVASAPAETAPAQAPALPDFGLPDPDGN
ncbi:MAG: trypsin-like peptidase domain-containing protein [Rhodobacteraceae bacterium]|nr:trypsin-like peptidase domain-containing protein [Paracoccaceae bacterium]MCP5341752.1 trypsin-like peptidase domain-containing protein [Paracoccaceae bacterium]